jgi:dihydrofolate reductase
MATRARNRRKIIVHIATSADGYIARPNHDIDWLTNRPAPKGFYGMEKFMRSIDTSLLGRKTYEISLKMGATFDPKSRTYVFSRRPSPRRVPDGVEFIKGGIGAFANRLKREKGKNIWMIGGADIIGSFLDAGAIDEFVVSIVPVFIGKGIPLIAPRHRHIRLTLRSMKRFPDGVVQVHYTVGKAVARRRRS